MASEIRQGIAGWTQNPEPPVHQQEIVTYPMHSEESMSLSDFLELLTITYRGSFHYEAHEHELQPIYEMEFLPTDRSFLVEHTYSITKRQLSDALVWLREGWNQHGLVTTTAEHTGFLLFYQTASFQGYNEYTCMYTYYDGTFDNHRRFVYRKEHIRATSADWEALMNLGKVWINPGPIHAQFPMNDADVLEKTRRHRIPVIEVDQATQELMIHTS